MTDADRPEPAARGSTPTPPTPTPKVNLPPRWFIRAFWVAHRAVYAVTRGHVGLRPSRPDRWGMLRLRTVGRHSGEERVAILAYLEDEPNLVLIAMNGWARPDPAWWLNLQAHPDAVIDLPDGTRDVSARLAVGEERSRLWAAWAGIDKDLDAYAARRSDTPVIVLEPRIRRPA